MCATNLALGAGLSQVAGKVFRIGHVGDLNELSLLGAIAGAEMSLIDNGVNVTPARAWPPPPATCVSTRSRRADFGKRRRFKRRRFR